MNERIIQHIEDKINRDKQIIEKLEKDENGSIKYPGDILFVKHLQRWIKSYEEDLIELRK